MDKKNKAQARTDKLKAPVNNDPKKKSRSPNRSGKIDALKPKSSVISKDESKKS